MVAAEESMGTLIPRLCSGCRPAGGRGERRCGALILAAQDGSLEAFNRLVRRHERAVYNVALRLVGASMAAEEVTQDTFMRAYGALARFRGGDPPLVDADRDQPGLRRVAPPQACLEFGTEELTYEPEVERRRRPAWKNPTRGWNPAGTGTDPGRCPSAIAEPDQRVASC